MAETVEEKNDRIAKLIALSPTAKNNVEREAYHMSFPMEELDGYIDPVKQEAFIGLVEDLETIGVYFTCPNEDIYSESEITLDGVLSVLEWILPNSLYPKLRQYPALVTGIKTILEGVSDDPIIIDYLAYLGGGLGRAGLRPGLRQWCDFLVYNTRVSGIFAEYLENMIAMIQDERVLQTSVPTNIEGWNKFRDRVIDASATAVNAMLESDTLLDEGDGHRLVMRFRTQMMQPFSAPEFHDLLVFVYLTDINSLSVESQILYKKSVKDYHTSCKLYEEYFAARELKITGFDVLCFLIREFAFSDTPQIFERQAEDIRKKYPMFPIVDDWINTLTKLKGTDQNG